MDQEYISRVAAMLALGCEDAAKYGNKTPEQRDRSYSTLMLYEIADAIDGLPAADVAPVIHAHWTMAANGYGVCSNCSRGDHIDPLAGYCRYCGAKMKEE